MATSQRIFLDFRRIRGDYRNNNPGRLLDYHMNQPSEETVRGYRLLTYTPPSFSVGGVSVVYILSIHAKFKRV